MATNGLENYCWGEHDFSNKRVYVMDTSLRDGLQDSRLRHPDLEEKMEFIKMLAEVGIDAIDIAIPVAGGSHLRDAIKLTRAVPEHINVACLARTQEVDIQSAIELSQGAGRAIEGIIFVGSSPLRRFVEGWELDEMTRWMEDSVELAVRWGIAPVVATEHTTETEPEVIKQLYRAGLEKGGKKICIADTTGAATPRGVRKLVRFFKEEVLTGFPDVATDWHGHNDRDMAVTNSLEALAAGVERVHVSALGIGERAGNTRLESILVNLKLAHDPRRENLRCLPALSSFSSSIFDVEINPNYPIIGAKVFDTASGIHAAAMEKAEALGIEPGAPYSTINPRWVGRESGVKIGPLSGSANVRMVARSLGLHSTDVLVDAALDYAKKMNKVLTDDEVKRIARSVEENGNGHN